MEKPLIIFDLDGTLIDSAPDLHVAAAALLAEQERPALPLATIRSFVGNGVPKLVERVCLASELGSEPEMLAALSRRFSELYKSDPVRLSKPYPGVGTALLALREQGHMMAVCTNKPEEISRIILDRLGLLEYFGIIVGGDTLPVKKPDPAPVRHAMQELGSMQALYVGDSETDAETALRAKLAFILFTEGYRHTSVEAMSYTRSFADFGDLPNIVAELL